MVHPNQSLKLHGVPSEVGGAWGAAYAVGTPISALVTGICCALAIEYFQQFPRDATRIRLSVIVVIATTILGLLLAMDLTYVRLVKNATPPGGFGDIPWQDDAVALICGTCQLICSAYFAYSAYSVATRKKLLLVWYALLMAVIFLGAFFRAILGLAPTDWLDGAALCPKMTFLWLIASLLLDFSIAVTLLAHLRKTVPTLSVHGVPPLPIHCNVPYCQSVVQPPRAPLLSRLLTTILTSFSLTAILMFSLLILVLAMHGTEFDPQLPKATGIFTALRLLATPTYAITFLYTLNRRNIRGVFYQSPIFNQQMLPLASRTTRNPQCVIEQPQTFKKDSLTVQFPNVNDKSNWTQPTYFASLESTTTSSRSVPQANGAEDVRRLRNLQVPTALNNYSSTSIEMDSNDVQPSISEVLPVAHTRRIRLPPINRPEHPSTCLELEQCPAIGPLLESRERDVQFFQGTAL